MPRPDLNPRFAQWLRAEGVRWDGEKASRPMWEFMEWVSARRIEFGKAHPEHVTSVGGIVSHPAFDAWLEDWVERAEAPIPATPTA